MAKIITIPGFKGGYTNDEYSPLATQTYKNAKDLEVFTNTNVLTPHLALGADLTDKTRNNIKLDAAIKASDGRIYFKGADNTSGTTLTIWDAGTAGLGSSTALSAETTASGTASDSKHNMVEFKDNLFYYDSSTTIQKFNFSTITGATVSSVSSQAPLFVHDGLGKIFYTTSAYAITYSTSTTLGNTAALSFDTNLRVVQMAPFGNFVAIGLNTINDSKNSKIALWDGNATTVADLIDVGDTGMQSLVNCNGALYFFTSSNTAGSAKFNVIRLYRWAGGRVELLKELDLKATVANLVRINTAAVAVDKDTIYFGLNAPTASSMTIDNGVWAYNSRTGILTLDRVTEDTSNVNIQSINFINNAPVVTWNDGTNYRINHTFASGSKSALGEYETVAFPLNGGLPGKIKRITLNHRPIPSGCGFTVQIKQYGHYPWGTTVPSEDSYADLVTPEGSGSSTGKTQSTNNACVTEIIGNELFKECRYVQLKIKFDEISSTNAAGIVFPILVETVE